MDVPSIRIAGTSYMCVYSVHTWTLGPGASWRVEEPVLSSLLFSWVSWVRREPSGLRFRTRVVLSHFARVSLLGLFRLQTLARLPFLFLFIHSWVIRSSPSSLSSEIVCATFDKKGAGRERQRCFFRLNTSNSFSNNRRLHALTTFP